MHVICLICLFCSFTNLRTFARSGTLGILKAFTISKLSWVSLLPFHPWFCLPRSGRLPESRFSEKNPSAKSYCFPIISPIIAGRVFGFLESRSFSELSETVQIHWFVFIVSWKDLLNTGHDKRQSCQAKMIIHAFDTNIRANPKFVIFRCPSNKT